MSGRPLRLGVHAGLPYAEPADLVAIWRLVEERGFDFVSTSDHLYSSNGTSDRHCPEGVATHTLLAATTSRVECRCVVYAAAFRHPAILAKAVATIDRISGGRACVGVGTGWNRREFTTFGLTDEPLGRLFDRLEEYVAVLRGLLADTAPVDFAGSFYRLEGAVCEPGPVRVPMPILMGGVGERRTLPLAARVADGWNAPFVSPEVFRAKRELLRGHCAAAGRDVEDLECSANVALARDDAHLAAQYGRTAELVAPGALMGSPDRIRERVEHYRKAGADAVCVLLGPERGPGGAQRYDPEDVHRVADALADLLPS